MEQEPPTDALNDLLRAHTVVLGSLQAGAAIIAETAGAAAVSEAQAIIADLPDSAIKDAVLCLIEIVSAETMLARAIGADDDPQVTFDAFAAHNVDIDPDWRDRILSEPAEVTDSHSLPHELGHVWATIIMANPLADIHT